ncbi:MAG: alpha/beta fold hydrolase, partial [Gemmatimonadetes bacterium]|nr:alpha/beta fold hydrolase [Gemmatimonadota bacterium]
MTTRERTVRGVTLFERQVGSEGPLVPVLHGGPGAHHDYLLPGFDALATGRQLVYYDQRGGGKSAVDRSVPVGWREHVADLEALRRELGVSSMRILAHSMGTFLAMSYLREHPDRVRDLILLGAIPAHFDGAASLDAFMQGSSSELMQRDEVRREAERLQLPEQPSARQQTEAWRLRFASVNLHH